jgi:hypothetical protein
MEKDDLMVNLNKNNEQNDIVNFPHTTIYVK